MKSDMRAAKTEKRRAELFRYAGLEVDGNTLLARYDLDGRTFVETVAFEGVGPLTPPARSVAELWYLLAGLSYYKAGAARRVDVGTLPLGEHGRALLRAALSQGLAEFAYRNDLSLDDVEVVGGVGVAPEVAILDPAKVLVPFGGGIDSVVTTESLAPHLARTLFVVSPAAGRFASLEATAAVTGLATIRASRALDPESSPPSPPSSGATCRSRRW